MNAVSRKSGEVVPALLSDDGAAALYSISVRKFHELRAAEDSFVPRPIKLGPRLLRWSREELLAAVAAMPRAEPGAEPVHLKQAKRRASQSVTEVR